MRAWLTLLIGIVLAANVCVAQAPTFQGLMDPTVFPDAQFGMKVSQVATKGSRIRVVTTGSLINIDQKSGQVRFMQRVDHMRRVATLKIGKPLEGVVITDRGEGFARITVEKPNLTIRINGDSLFMLHAHEPLELNVESAIVPAWNASWKTNHLVVDEWGGFALYCSDLVLDDHFDALGSPVAKYPIPADGVLCVGVCPPKAYPWDRSIDQQVIWHWSDKTGYPSDKELHAWAPYGNTVLLQSEVMLWKDWNLDFVPRLGMDEFVRVRETLHGMKMPFIVYTSPFYFLKGTSQEKQAVNDKPGVCPGAITTGENMPLFLDAITRVMTNLKPDGLYFDGQYSENPAGLYALARSSRQIIGNKGILEWHSTVELGGGQMYMPQADAYTDIQLRGEGQDSAYGSFDYLRFFVSGYNINNCIGVLCNNSGKPMTLETLDALLKANGRLHTLLGMKDFINNEYRPRLTADLRTSVEKITAERQVKVPERAAALKKFLAGPDWKGEPARAIEFDSMPEGGQIVSKANSDAFRIADGALHVTAHAHTHAYLRIPLDVNAGGFVVKLKQDTDKGMSWGPAAMLRFSDGTGIRIGTRVNGLQADILGAQILGPAYDPSQWVWLRARWTDGGGVVEWSTDGDKYQRFHSFTRPTDAKDKTAELLVGKVPYNGQPSDNTEPGDLGGCQVDFVRIYEANLP